MTDRRNDPNDAKRPERDADRPLTPDEEVDEASEESFPASDPPESHHID